MNFIARPSIAFLTICCLLPELAFSQAVADKDKRDILKRAEESYYNLPKEGLANFRCAVAPNFEDVVADLRSSNPAAADAWSKDLGQIQITVVVGSDGKATVSHNDISDENLKTIADDTDHMITDFFQRWAPYVVGTVFPALDADYQWEDLGSQYRLSFKDGATSSVITLEKDLSVDAVMITEPGLDSATWPEFTKSAKGFVPTSIDSDLRIPANGGVTHVATTVTYQEVSGFELPKTVRTDITSGDNSDEVVVDFTGCTAVKR
jgi:hypothetical protein